MTSSSEYIVVENVHKAFNHSAPVIADLSMKVAEGEFVALFGPNGCGKTTFLRILTGIDNDYQGSVKIGGKLPRQASVGIVPQNSEEALLPWRTALENIALPLELDRLSHHERTRVVREFIEGTGLQLNLDMYPYRLSGGQKQLVAIARALVVKPDLMVLDEPFSALDYGHMSLVEEALLQLWQVTGTTTLLVIHDLLEAVYLADRIILLSPRPMRVVLSAKIDLPRPRSRQEPRLISALSKLQRAYLAVE
jgi:NitT/TauT family transport system ATP-binding protein